MELRFLFVLDSRVTTPFGAKGIVKMLGYDEGGKQYYIKTEKNSGWFKETDLIHGWEE